MDTAFAILTELAFSKKKADDRKEWLRHFRVHVRFRLCDATRVQLIDCVCSQARISTTTWMRSHIPIHGQGIDPFFHG